MRLRIMSIFSEISDENIPIIVFMLFILAIVIGAYFSLRKYFIQGTNSHMSVDQSCLSQGTDNTDILDELICIGSFEAQEADLVLKSLQDHDIKFNAVIDDALQRVIRSYGHTPTKIEVYIEPGNIAVATQLRDAALLEPESPNNENTHE